MLKTIEAVIDTRGRVHLLENVKLDKSKQALVTILDEDAVESGENSLVGTMEILSDDLEGGSRLISEMFNQSLEKSAEDLKD
jgi:hypothetical protein